MHWIYMDAYKKTEKNKPKINRIISRQNMRRQKSERIDRGCIVQIDKFFNKEDNGIANICKLLYYLLKLDSGFFVPFFNFINTK